MANTPSIIADAADREQNTKQDSVSPAKATIDQLLRDFEAADLAAGTFHHLQHVQVAWAYLERFPLISALTHFSDGIRRLAATHGADRLYHETITWAYVFLIHERRQRSGNEATWESFAEQNPDLLSWKPSVLEAYYRKETLDSPLARSTFVLPDLGIAGDVTAIR